MTNKLVSLSPPTSEELKLINSFTYKPLTVKNSIVFSFILCNNDIDKDFERFTVESLFKLKELFVGKFGYIEGQINVKKPQIFYCDVIADEDKSTKTNDQYFYLVAKAFLPINKDTEETIELMKNGILKEVSIGCSVSEKLCSICRSYQNTVLHSNVCNHLLGKRYKKNLCYFELCKPNDAYEWNITIERDKNENS